MERRLKVESGFEEIPDKSVDQISQMIREEAEERMRLELENRK